MRARSISHYAVEQKESRPIRGAASHIRQGMNDRKSACKHAMSAFLIRSPLLFLKKSVIIPPGSARSGGGVRVWSISYHAVEQNESRSIRGAASHIRKEVNDQELAPTHLRSAFLVRCPLGILKKKENSEVIPPGSASA